MRNRPVNKKRFYAYCLFLALLGLGFSIELLVIHLTVSEDPFHPFSCHVARAMDCNAVALSRESMFLGLPVPVWAILTYLLFGALALPGLIKGTQSRASRTADYIIIIAAWSVVYSAYLAYISAFSIGTFCAYCTSLYFVNLGLLFASLPLARPVREWLSRRREEWRYLTEDKVKLAFLIFVIVVASGGLAFFYSHTNKPETLKLVKGVDIDLSQDPSIGPYRAPVTIIEWSDYECPHCNRMHQRIEILLEKYKGKIRYVHKSYPLEPQCNPYVSVPMHINACEAARAAECAFQKGRHQSYSRKLWDVVAKRGTLDEELLLKIAEKEGMDGNEFQACMESARTKAAVQKDIEDAHRAGVNATPTFIVNGYKFSGGRDVKWCSRLIERFLAGKKPPRAEKIAGP